MSLLEWMKNTGTSVAELALKLGVTKQAIYLWLSGENCPNAKSLLGLHRLTKGKVTVESFVTALEQDGEAING